MLEGTARDWLKALPPFSYDSWEDFSRDFMKNFEPLAVRPKTFEELRSCVQKQTKHYEHTSGDGLRFRTQSKQHPKTW